MPFYYLQSSYTTTLPSYALNVLAYLCSAEAVSPVGWSGQGRTTFQWVVGLVRRLQSLRPSEDETIGPDVPRTGKARL